MKLSLPIASRLLARLGQGLHILKRALRVWVPPQAPRLVPIPIRSERRARHAERRYLGRDD